MVQFWQRSNSGVEGSPELYLVTLAKVMNGTVVKMMSSIDELKAGELPLFDSIKTIEGYMSLYHLLLAFIQKYPGNLPTIFLKALVRVCIPSEELYI